MKKILFSLVALVCSMSMNAQVIEIYKGETLVATYNAKKADRVVFKEAQPEPTTGTAKATINNQEVDVNWVQLWEDGPKFAEFNVGAANNKAEDYGGYYTWGGTYANGDGIAHNDDHNTDSAVLTGNNDTATKLWGSAWRMPTKAEFDDLLAKCDVEWTTVNGVNGRKYTGKGDYSSNRVFLPAAGLCYDGYVISQGYNYYWSSTPHGSIGAQCLLFSPDDAYVDACYRGGGYSVRAVLAE